MQTKTDTKRDDAHGQVTRSAAQIYEEFFVPALFAAWAPQLADAAGLSPGQRALDVACGTGVLARELARRVGPGATTGLDRNPGMLEMAARVAPEIQWQRGHAESLPFEDASFDAVVSQFGLMFFDDRVQALREMARVLRPGGRIVVAVWATLERTPGYAAMTALLARLFGEKVAAELRAPYVLGDPETLRGILVEAGLAARVDVCPGRARFDSLDAWLHTDIRGWTLANAIDEAQFARLRDEAASALAEFVGSDGRVEFDAPACIALCQPT